MSRKPKPMQKCEGCGAMFKAKGTTRKFCSQPCSQQFNDAGRKLFDGRDEKEVIEKCKEVWLFGGTDAEAAYFAEISKETLSNYLTDNPKIKELRDRLKEYPKLKARKTIVEGLNEWQNAWAFAKKVAKDEFGDEQPPAPTVNNFIDLGAEALARLKKYEDKA